MDTKGSSIQTLEWFAAGCVVCGLLLIAPSSASAACDGSAARSGLQTIATGSVTRTFVVRIPASHDGRTPAPIVFVFHPFGMNAQYMQSRVPIGRAWPEAIAVYADGLPRDSANASPAWQTKPGELENRDVLFFDAMLAWVMEHGCADVKRVFVMGYSNGAQFASVLACERSSVIAGVAIASGRLACPPPAAKPVVISHGVRDATIAYEQGVAAAQAWTQRNACSAPPKTGVAGCFSGDMCSASPVMLCTFAGGHEYNTPFTATVAQFFKALPQ